MKAYTPQSFNSKRRDRVLERTDLLSQTSLILFQNQQPSGLQPQLALDMTWSLTIMSQEGQPRKRDAGLGSPALRKKLNPSAFYHECALTTLIRKEIKKYKPIRRQIERARRMEDSPINKRGTRSCQTSFRPLCLPLADRTNWPDACLKRGV